MRVLYSIQGNIGSGKTTLLKLLQKSVTDVDVVKQPVDSWMHVGKYNLLEKYYQDPQRWAFTFQVNALQSRMTLLNKILKDNSTDKKMVFAERSVIADKQIFAKLLLKLGRMSQMEFQVYDQVFNSLNSLFEIPKVHKFIYLRTSPSKCLERIKKRARTGQSEISLDYLKQIHKLHQNWMLRQQAQVVDGDWQFQHDWKQLRGLQTIMDRFSKQSYSI